MQFESKTVVVSGANRGIGRAIVSELLSRGVKKIYAGTRHLENLPNFDDARVVPLLLDITNPEQIQAAAATAQDANILINNAGVAGFASLLSDENALFERDMRTNYYGTLDMMRAFIPVLEGKKDASIVNIISIVAFANFPSAGAYSASKAALFSASQGIRTELSPRGIQVHTVNPGPIDTDIIRSIEMDKAPVGPTAKNIVDSLIAGEIDIFPDAMSRQMLELWKNDYRQLEQMVYQMHHNIS